MTARVWEQTDEKKNVRIKHYRVKNVGYVTLTSNLLTAANNAAKELNAAYGDIISVNGVHFIYENYNGCRRMGNFELMNARFESALPPAS